jgi:tetratricopeptide (TPR) repeat protein
MDIRKGWAETPEDAQVALMLYASQQDAPAYLETLNDFIAAFPNISAGYLNRASHYACYRKKLAASETEQMRLLSLAQADMETAAKYPEKKGERFYEQAKLIYSVASDDSTLQAPAWSMAAARANIRKAIDGNDEPAYRQLEGDIAFSQGDYEQAYESYRRVSQSPLASGVSCYMAAKARQQMPGASLIEVVSLIDSAIEKSAALPNDALAYLQENAALKMQLGMYDAVVADYDRCYTLMAGNVSDAFYYLREQARFRAGDLDGAQKDISSAIILDPQNAVYYAEEASVYLRRQQPDKAQESSQKAISLDPDFASGHRLLGVSYLRQEKKDEACKAFRKAKELGDPVVDKLIGENCR